MHKWGVPNIHVITVIASKKGLQTLNQKYNNDISITVGEVDDELTENEQVLPGIGDTSNRLYRMPLNEDGVEDYSIMDSTSKRKRSITDIL